MNLQFDQIHWPAVIVAGAVIFFLGGVWYMALFGKLWMKLHGYTEEKVKQMQAAKPPAVFFGGMIACDLVIAFVVGLLMASFKVEGAVDGALFGFLLWLGVAASIGFTSWLASDKHIGLYLIDAAYQLTFLIVAGVILGVWR